jgi:glycosyltransferase involved in cell wall biosynthesis
MKIGIDISQIAFEGFGIATYTKELVKELLTLDKKNNYVLFFSSMRRELKTDFSPAIVKKFKFPPTLLDLLWNRFHVLPIETLVGNIDVFHSSNWTQPPTKAKKVTTIHDMLIYKYPNTVHPKILATQKRQLSWVKKECDRIITDSYATKQDVLEILNIPENKVRVIHLAPGKEFNIPQEQEKISSVKNKYGIRGNYILTVGSGEPRKNLLRIIDVYNHIKHEIDLSLVIAGNFRWGNENKETDGIQNVGFVEKEDLPALYAGASAFLYPSLYEGFGLPVLEAQSMGCPVITSDRGSLKEIVGDSAIIVDPENTESIQKGIEKVLSISPDELKNIKSRGKLNAGLYTWEKTARETLKVYEELQ